MSWGYRITWWCMTDYVCTAWASWRLEGALAWMTRREVRFTGPYKADRFAFGLCLMHNQWALPWHEEKQSWWVMKSRQWTMLKVKPKLRTADGWNLEGLAETLLDDRVFKHKVLCFEAIPLKKTGFDLEIRGALIKRVGCRIFYSWRTLLCVCLSNVYLVNLFSSKIKKGWVL